MWSKVGDCPSPVGWLSESAWICESAVHACLVVVCYVAALCRTGGCTLSLLNSVVGAWVSSVDLAVGDEFESVSVCFSSEW